LKLIFKTYERMKFIIFFLLPTLTFAQDTLVYNTKRAVKLEGTSNFRDLGGYPTQNGKTVKWGHIYRSADISRLTDSDLKTLETLHLGVDCDLRGPDEVKNGPDRLPAGVQYVNLPAGSENIRMSEMGKMMRNPALRDSLMGASYGQTTHLKAKYKPMFDQLLSLDNNKALLFHCTAGKDRTGVGAALILSALGVPRDIILKDYEATNEYWKADRERMMKMMAQQGMPEDQLRPMMAANPVYLEQTFKAIDQTYGSMDKFLAQEMELTTEKLATLRTKYLN